MAILATAPDAYNALDHRLDPSYIWALNRAAADGLVHGRDFTFNYGPFGYLLFPLDIGSNLFQGLIAQWALWGLLGAALIGVARGGAPPWSVLVLGATIAIAEGLRFQTEYVWLLTLALVLTQSLAGRRISLYAGAAAGALAAFLVFVKLTVGLAAVPMMIVAVVALVGARTRASLQTIVATASGFVIVLVAVLAAHFGSLSYFARWMRLSIEISRGYSASMSLQGSSAELLLAWGVLLCFVCLAVSWLRERAASLGSSAIVSLPVILAYKHAFVRQATHAPLFFPVALVFLAALVPLADKDRSRRWAAVFFGAALVLVAAETGLRGHVAPSSFLANASGLSGLRRAAAFVRIPAVRRELAERSRENLKDEHLPSAWLEAIRREGGDVDVVPYELSLLPANDLPWRPGPVLQTYNAYTRLLDLACAEHLSGPRAPRFVILHMATIDLRHPLCDAPAMARALLRRYRMVDVDEAAQRVLLRLEPELAPEPDAAATPHPTEQRALLGEWIDVPKSSVPLAAEMAFRPLLRERLLKLTFRVPAVSMEVQYEDDRVVPLRILPETAEGGLPISHLPRDAASAAAFFARRPVMRVIRFRVGGLGALLFEPEFSLRWTPIASGA